MGWEWARDGLGIDPSAQLNSGANPPHIAGGFRCDGVISEPWAPHQDPQKNNVHDASSIKINHWGGLRIPVFLSLSSGSV